MIVGEEFKKKKKRRCQAYNIDSEILLKEYDPNGNPPAATDKVGVRRGWAGRRGHSLK